MSGHRRRVIEPNRSALRGTRQGNHPVGGPPWGYPPPTGSEGPGLMIRRVAALIAAGMLGSLLVTASSSAADPAAAVPAAGQGAGASGLFPSVIHLPDGWQPEG